MVAGCPSAQKSPARAVLHDWSPDEAQVALAVTVPCLHEPHVGLGLTMQESLLRRPESSRVEMYWQKSPGTAQGLSDEQGSPVVALQKPVVSGTAGLQELRSVLACEPQP
jgi:hypothetical protein